MPNTRGENHDDHRTERGKKKRRSPSYPFIPLETAVQRAEEFYEKNERHGASPGIAVGFWGYSEKSSGGQQTIAALKHYGLMKKEGKNVILTERGLDLAIPGSTERQAAIRAAALEPVAFRDLWEDRKDRLGSREQLEYELVRYKGFNPSSVGVFIDNYLKTVSFAGLRGTGESSDRGETEDRDGREGSEAPLPRIGDLVQWQSQGVDQFADGPLRVRDVQEIEEEQWVFVDGEASGFPASQIRIVEKAGRDRGVHMPSVVPPFAPEHQSGGDAVTFAVPFRGKTLSVQIRSQGEPLRRQHIEKVVKYLNLVKEDLEPGDSETSDVNPTRSDVSSKANGE